MRKMEVLQRKFIGACLSCALFLEAFFFSHACFAAAIPDDILPCLARVENDFGKVGTGFLYYVPSKVAPGCGRVYLITNKHVLADTEEQRQSATRMFLNMNTYSGVGTVKPLRIEYPLKVSGKNNWRGHPDPNVDVLLVDITRLINEVHMLQRKCLTDELFIDADFMHKYGVGVGSDVVMLGYPSGATTGLNNYPFARQGMISTPVGQKIILPDSSVPVRAFYVDSLAIPGSSGSPLFVKPSEMFTDFSKTPAEVNFGVMPPRLIGLVASSRLGEVETLKGKFQFFAGLGIVHPVETIKETLAQFEPVDGSSKAK